MNSECLNEEQISEYCDNNIDENCKIYIKEHLSQCSSCHDKMIKWQKVSEIKQCYDLRKDSPCISLNLFCAYLENSISSKNRSKMEEHLLSCKECRSILVNIQHSLNWNESLEKPSEIILGKVINLNSFKLKIEKQNANNIKKLFDVIFAPFKVVYQPVIVLASVFLLFIGYNSYLTDKGLENVYVVLSQLNKAKFVKEVKSLEPLVVSVLTNEILEANSDSAEVANLEFSKDIIKRINKGNQVKDIRFLLGQVIADKERNRSEILKVTDEINRGIIEAGKNVGNTLREKTGELIAKIAHADSIDDSSVSVYNEANSLLKRGEVIKALSKYRETINRYPYSYQSKLSYTMIKWIKASLKLNKEREKLISEITEETGSDVTLNPQALSFPRLAVDRRGNPSLRVTEKLYKLGMINILLYRYKEAKECFKGVVNNGSEYVISPPEAEESKFSEGELKQKSLYMIGWLYRQMENYEEARISFNSMKEQAAGIVYQIAQTYYDEGNYNKAVYWYRKNVEKQKLKSIAAVSQFKEGYTYLCDLNNPVKAKECFNELGKEYPDTIYAEYVESDLSNRISYGSELNAPVDSLDSLQKSGALEFDGKDDYIDVGNPENLQITGAITLSAWIYIKNYNEGRIIDKRGLQSSKDRCWSLNIESKGIGAFQISTDGNIGPLVNTTNILPAGQWVHLTGVYEPSIALRIYINGELNNTNSTNIPAKQYNNNLNVNIGRKADKICYFNGKIDEVMVYNEALSETEVYNNYSEQIKTKGLVSWWKLDEQAGTIATDSIGNNNGILHNFFESENSGWSIREISLKD